MSKKDNNHSMNGTTLGEISTIRDILMGQQIQDFETRFQSLQNQMAELEDKLNQKVKDVSKSTSNIEKILMKDMSGQISQLESQTEGRLNQLEQSLKDGLMDLQNKMEESNMNDRERIAKLLLDAGNNLLKS